MGSGSGSQAAMTVVWVVLAVLAAGGLGVFSLVRRRRARRSPAGKTGGGRCCLVPRHTPVARARPGEGERS